MGNALVLMVVPDELIGCSALHVFDADSGETKPIEQRRGMWIPGKVREAALREHPDAFFVMNVPYSAIWQPPEEPSAEHGHDWHWKPEVLRNHRQQVRKSLESFVNGRLRQLDGMVRTGWFIIERVRAKITALRAVPHRAGEKRPPRP